MCPIEGRAVTSVFQVRFEGQLYYIYTAERDKSWKQQWWNENYRRLYGHIMYLNITGTRPDREKGRKRQRESYGERKREREREGAVLCKISPKQRKSWWIWTPPMVSKRRWVYSYIVLWEHIDQLRASNSEMIQILTWVEQEFRIFPALLSNF